MIAFVDLFCGGGGMSTGFGEACDEIGLRYREIAVNHSNRAVETMIANHPNVRVLKMDIEASSPSDIDVQTIDLLHASPSCTHHSRAKGGKPRDNQLRSQPNEIWKFIDNKHVRRVTIENVPEFVDWGPLTKNGEVIKRKRGECFQAWLTQFTARGYKYEFRILNCADYGDATTRKRFFLQAVKNGCGKIRWPQPTHEENPQPDLFGRELKRWRGVRECLDLSDFGTSIFNRDRPLSRNTLRRVAVGMSTYNGMDFLMDMLGADGDDVSRVHPLTKPMPTQHSGGNRCAVVRPFIVKLKKNCWAEDIDSPLSTATTKESHVLCQPVIVDMSHPGDPNDERRVSGGGDPMKTITTRNNFAVCTPFIMNNNENNVPRPLDKPLVTLTTGNHAYLCTPLVLGQHGGAACRPIDDPCPTIATAGAIRIATPIILDMSRPGGHDSGHVRTADKPIQTLTTCDNVQVATPVIFDEAVGLPRLPDGRYIDILLRMLKPSELAAAHSFPPGYRFSGNRADQVKQIGNSIPVQTAKAIVKAIFAKEGTAA
ncbi:MAG: DNA cytosine methyltransferase [Kiritimatiellae bacterium]|nr:DNA cytosine methyltransferase [Kiritimatiellia bacterium]MBQ8126709.1 DNA cytosine methyltransferase [Kiritimatiellia bacterium]